MKSLLEGMVSTNARWISALSQAGVTFPRTLSDSTLNCSYTSLSEAVSPIEPEPSPVFGSTVDEKFAAMKLAYVSIFWGCWFNVFVSVTSRLLTNSFLFTVTGGVTEETRIASHEEQAA